MRFVDPDAELKAGLKITSAHRFVVEDDPRAYFHVRIGTRQGIDLISLSVSNVTGVHRLSLEDAHHQFCGDVETCISLFLPPGPPLDAERIALEAPSIGHRHEQGLNVERLGGYALEGAAIDDNRRVSVTLDDPIRSFLGGTDVAREYDEDGELIAERVIELFPRTFDHVLTLGACSGPESAAHPGWKPSSNNPFVATSSFSAGLDPETCASVRPSLPRGGAGVAALTIRARAVIERFSHAYAPASEISPLVAIPLFDLEIPNEERCSAAQNLVRAAVLDAATEIAADEMNGAEVFLLESVQLATKDGLLCKQADDRTFDALNVADDIRTAITERFGPERRVRVVLIYASNLNLEVPFSLGLSLQLLRTELMSSAPDRSQVTVAIAPDRPALSVSPDRSMPWLASEEPAFRTGIKQLLQSMWPFKTMLHNAETLVPLIEEEARGRYAAFRICSSSHLVQAAGTKHPESNVFYTGPEGPGYRVDLPPQILVESASFDLPLVTVEWEGCVELCDHTAPKGVDNTPWERTEACQ